MMTQFSIYPSSDDLKRIAKHLTRTTQMHFSAPNVVSEGIEAICKYEDKGRDIPEYVFHCLVASTLSDIRSG
jgi:hypothetical protein